MSELKDLTLEELQAEAEALEGKVAVAEAEAPEIPTAAPVQAAPRAEGGGRTVHADGEYLVFTNAKGDSYKLSKGKLKGILKLRKEIKKLL